MPKHPTVPLTCPAGHHWQAMARPARLGDCASHGTLIVLDDHDLCPECGLVAGPPAHCWVCDEPLTQERVCEIADRADKPESLQPRDFLCAAHDDAVAGDDSRPRETADWFGLARRLAESLNPQPRRVVP